MTITLRPIRCPHGAALMAGSVPAAYEDDCRATSGAPVRFWCGEGEMSKPNGVSVTAGEYLLAWSEAIGIEIGRKNHAWLLERKAEEDARNFEAAHAEALILNEGDELYDEAEHEDYHRTLEAADHAEYQRFADAHPMPEPAACTFRGLISKRPCTLPADHDGVHSVWDSEADDHAAYLAEVPWTDRIED